MILGSTLFSSCCTLHAQLYTRTEAGIQARVGDLELELVFFNAQTVRIKKYPVSAGTAKSFTVIQSPAKTIFSLTAKERYLFLRSRALTIRVDLGNGRLQFSDHTGKPLLQEEGYAVLPLTGENQHGEYTVRQSFRLEEEEAIYGFGQFQNGHLNQRHRRLVLEQQNMQIAIPFFQSVKQYGLLWDNASVTTVSDSANTLTIQSNSGEGIDYYFMSGKDADAVMSNFRSLTGQVPLLPKWALGYFQSRERYTSQSELLEVVKKYRALQVPLDVIVQDWQYWGEDNRDWNAVAFGNPRFPDPQAMIDSVHKMNARIIISVWPSFGPRTRIYNELKKENLLLGFNTFGSPDARVYDPFNPAARKIYWQHMHDDLFAKGIDGWWLDATEPERTGPDSIIGNMPTYLGPFRKVANAFPLASTGGVYEQQRRATSGKRVFILTRSAFAGQQRFATAIWSGDVQGNWQVLKKQPAAGCNASMSGIPYWNADIGGFFIHDRYPKGIHDTAFHELYVRWLQFSAFCPLLRSHGTHAPREIYQFGSKGYWAYDAIEKFIRLRYRLLPYNYSMAWQVTSRSSSMMRPLVMDFPHDKKVWNSSNEYMFGPSFLVCPVTDSLYVSRVNGLTRVQTDSIRSISVYLPQGTAWFDFWTGQKLNGGQTVDPFAPIDQVPLFVRAGTVLPLAYPMQYTGEKADTVLEVRIYPGANGEFELYEDGNDSYDYEKGMYSLITFRWNDAAKKLSVSARKGRFPGMLHKRMFRVILVNKEQGTGIATPGRAARQIVYSGKAITVQL